MNIKNLVAIFALLFFANSLLYFFIPSSRQKITQTIPGSLLVSVLSIVLFMASMNIFDSSV